MRARPVKLLARLAAQVRLLRRASSFLERHVASAFWRLGQTRTVFAGAHEDVDLNVPLNIQAHPRRIGFVSRFVPRGPAFFTGEAPEVGFAVGLGTRVRVPLGLLLGRRLCSRSGGGHESQGSRDEQAFQHFSKN